MKRAGVVIDSHLHLETIIVNYDGRHLSVNRVGAHLL